MTALLAVPLLALLAVVPWALRAAPAPAEDRAPRTGTVDGPLQLDLAAAALRSGASVPAALSALGAAIGGDHGTALGQAGRLLLMGADWAEAWHGCPPALSPLAGALEPAWCDGVDPLPLLERRAEQVRADRHRRAQEAASRLGVRLVLPLGLCFLPAFLLLGVVPVLLTAGADLLGP